MLQLRLEKTLERLDKQHIISLNKEEDTSSLFNKFNDVIYNVVEC